MHALYRIIKRLFTHFISELICFVCHFVFSLLFCGWKLLKLKWIIRLALDILLNGIQIWISWFCNLLFSSVLHRNWSVNRFFFIMSTHGDEKKGFTENCKRKRRKDFIIFSKKLSIYSSFRSSDCVSASQRNNENKSVTNKTKKKMDKTSSETKKKGNAPEGEKNENRNHLICLLHLFISFDSHFINLTYSNDNPINMFSFYFLFIFFCS